MDKFKIILRIIIFAVIGILIFFLITPIFMPKTINEKKGFYRAFIQGFYTEPKDSLDVIFLGESSVNTAISPIEIWKEAGFTSYAYASPNQKIWDSYYCIKDIIKYQKPKVIVLNVDQAFSEKPMKNAYKRHLYDNMPTSSNKLEAITDPVQKNKKGDILNLTFPLLRFHSRWSELDEDDFLYANQYYHYPLKGYRMTKDTKPYKGNKSYMEKENKKDKMGKKVTEYLTKIKSLCEENDIELLLIEIPAPKSWNKTKSEEITNWANKNDITFIDMNLLVERLEINWDTDTKDAGYHMNIYGAEKISAYMSKYLKENYKLPDHRADTNYEHWNEDTKIYMEEKNRI